MLNVFRENLKHLKWVLWIVALSMVMYLGAYFVGGDKGGTGADWVAKVEGRTISTQEFLEAARRQDEIYRKMLGQNYDQFRASLNLGTQVVQQLIDRQIMLAEARKAGIGASKEDLQSRILADPGLKDASGNFIGRESYVQAVNAGYPGGVAAFEAGLAQDITLMKWTDLVTQPAGVGDDELEREYRLHNEKAAFDYVFVPESDRKIDETVTDADARAFWAAHADDYRRGEGRKLRVIVVSRESMASKVAVTDEDVRKYYDDNASQFSRPEQRRASHILFRVDPKASEEDRKSVRALAESVLARAKKGEDFAGMARAMSQDKGSGQQGGDLGWFGAEDMVPEFGKAAFSTPVGELSPVVETQFGYHVLLVTDSRAAGEIPFDDVKGGIRRQLEVKKRQDAVAAEAAKVAQAVTNIDGMDAAAKAEGYAAVEKSVYRDDANGDLAPSPELLDKVFSTPVGKVAPPAPVASGMAIAGVLEELPASVRPFEEIQAKVRADVVADRRRTAALEAARKIATSGAPLASGAKALGREVKSSGDVGPGFALPDTRRSPELETAIFSPQTVVGSRGAASVPGGAVAYAVTRHDAFDRPRFEASKDALRRELLDRRRRELLEGILRNLRRDYAVEVNDAVIQSVNS